MYAGSWGFTQTPLHRAQPQTPPGFRPRLRSGGGRAEPNGVRGVAPAGRSPNRRLPPGYATDTPYVNSIGLITFFIAAKIMTASVMYPVLILVSSTILAKSGANRRKAAKLSIAHGSGHARNNGRKKYFEPQRYGRGETATNSQIQRNTPETLSFNSCCFTSFL